MAREGTAKARVEILYPGKSYVAEFDGGGIGCAIRNKRLTIDLRNERQVAHIDIDAVHLAAALCDAAETAARTLPAETRQKLAESFLAVRDALLVGGRNPG